MFATIAMLERFQTGRRFFIHGALSISGTLGGSVFFAEALRGTRKTGVL